MSPIDRGARALMYTHAQPNVERRVMRCCSAMQCRQKKKVYGRLRKNEQQHDSRKKSASTHTNSSAFVPDSTL